MEVRDPAALRALAHPVRQRILMQLAVAGHARAADLAEAIGQPANSVSFHLRVLARAGMIAEAPEHARDRRDRVWTNVATSYQVRPDAGDAAETILRPALRWVTDVFHRRARQDDGDDPGDDPGHDSGDDAGDGDGEHDRGGAAAPAGDDRERTQAARQFVLTTVLLTPEQGRAMARELEELLARWSEQSLAEARTDQGTPREAYQVLSVLAPRDDSPGTATATDDPAGDPAPDDARSPRSR